MHASAKHADISVIFFKVSVQRCGLFALKPNCSPDVGKCSGNITPFQSVAQRWYKRKMVVSLLVFGIGARMHAVSERFAHINICLRMAVNR